MYYTFLFLFHFYFIPVYLFIYYHQLHIIVISVHVTEVNNLMYNKLVSKQQMWLTIPCHY
jgi:hypothetical protein